MGNFIQIAFRLLPHILTAIALVEAARKPNATKQEKQDSVVALVKEGVATAGAVDSNLVIPDEHVEAATRSILAAVDDVKAAVHLGPSR